MQVLTLEVNDTVSEKLTWLLGHFEPNEVKIIDQDTYVDDDTYLRSVKGMTESLKSAQREPVEQGTPLSELNW